MATNKLFQNLNVDSKPTETVKSDVIKQSRPKNEANISKITIRILILKLIRISVTS